MNIWSAWLQGRKNAPKHVQSIFDLWENLNPSSTFTVLENEQVDAILSEMGVSTWRMTPQVKTDIARTYLLAKHGGAWVDSTLLPTQPLEDWLVPDLRRQGFFAFRSTGRPELVLQNWFLYADKGNALIKAWLELYCDYFRVKRFPPNSKRIFFSRHALDYARFNRAERHRDSLFFVDPKRGRSCRMYPYAFHNFTLAYLLKTDEQLAELWSGVPTLFHVQPSLIGHCAGDAETPDDTLLRLSLSLLPSAPVHKLNHRDVRFATLIDHAKSEGLIETGDGCLLSYTELRS